jgi:hypothetical protein
LQQYLKTQLDLWNYHLCNLDVAMISYKRELWQMLSQGSLKTPVIFGHSLKQGFELRQAEIKFDTRSMLGINRQERIDRKKGV